MNENTPATTQPKTVATKPRTLRDHLESPALLAEIAKALPRHMKPERMARVAITAMTRTPALNDCTPESFFKCLLDLSALGLEPDGRRAHLIPFRDNRTNTTVCTLIVDYKGLAELAYNSGVVSYLHADVIREGDLFQFSKGELREHVPWFMRRDAGRPAESGPVFAAYAMARLKDGSEKVDVLSLEELNSIRDASQGYKMSQKYGKPSPWTTNESEMQKKTAFRRLTKWLPLSPEIHDRLAVEDEDEARFSAAKPVHAAAPKFLTARQGEAARTEIPPVDDIPIAEEPAVTPEPEPVQRETAAMRRAKSAPAAPVATTAPAQTQSHYDALWTYLTAKGCANWEDFSGWLATYNHIKPDSATRLEELPLKLVLSLMSNDQAMLAGYVKTFGGAK